MLWLKCTLCCMIGSKALARLSRVTDPDDKINTIYGYFAVRRSGSNDLRYHSEESRTLAVVNHREGNTSHTAKSGGFLTEHTQLLLLLQVFCITEWPCRQIWQVGTVSDYFKERVKQFSLKNFIPSLCPYFRTEIYSSVNFNIFEFLFCIWINSCFRVGVR